MNLFTARLTGKMLSTDAFEQEIVDMLARVERWRAIEKSPELVEYLALKKEVEILTAALPEEGKVYVRRYGGVLERLDAVADICVKEGCGFIFF